MLTLDVPLADRSYRITIGAGVRHDASLFAPWVSGRAVMVVTNETVAPLYLADLQATLGTLGVTPGVVVLPDGEAYKDWAHLQRIFDALLAARAGRRAVLIALGGGVVGDMTGFAAACYQRGIDFVQVPTTLLAQVDSSVGGKTGINHPLGKNMIGAFHQPLGVVIDTDVLATLPAREYAAGLAEVIKYGLIRDLAFWDWLLAHRDALMAREPAPLAEAIRRSCQCKADIVAADERETTDIRALLNLGHTFGHAIETGVGYGSWLHGEAVGTGLLMAADLSWRRGWLPGSAVTDLRGWLQAVGLPVVPPEMPVARWRALMAVDKKNVSGQLRLVLLQGLGQAVVCDDTPDALLDETLSAGDRLGVLS